MAEPFGRYQLLKRIAGGGMGEVYLARQSGIQGFEKLLVIKTLLPHLSQDSEFVQMFLDEARIAARLAHPNVVSIFDLGEVQGVYYIAMEYVHGEDIKRVWRQAYKRGEAIPIALACRVVADAAAGLGYAHRLADDQGSPLGLVHRDVSPQNVLVSFDGGVKLIDFGVAKAAGRATKTQTGALKGKYAYMSPEQADGEAIDQRSDVFALGIVLWEMVTGSRLFKADNDVATLKAVVRCQVAPASTQNPSVPPELDPIVAKALSKDREARYQTMDEFRLAIENWLAATGAHGSAAHLAEFMRRLFDERLEKEGAKGPLWDVDPDATGFSPFGGTPGGTAIQRRGRAGSGSDSSSLKSLGPGQVDDPAQARGEPVGSAGPRRPAALWAAGGAVAAAALGFAGYALLRPPPALAPMPPALVRPAAPVPVVPALNLFPSPPDAGPSRPDLPPPAPARAKIQKRRPPREPALDIKMGR